MGNAINMDSRVLWQMMRAQGGWWTVKMLVQYWKPAFAEFEVEELLRGLVHGRFVAQREIAPDVQGYAVTSDCLVLPGADA